MDITDEYYNIALFVNKADDKEKPLILIEDDEIKRKWILQNMMREQLSANYT